MLETALEAEQLGHECGQRPVGANMRNGAKSKTVLTEIRRVEIDVARRRCATHEPALPPRRGRQIRVCRASSCRGRLRIDRRALS